MRETTMQTLRSLRRRGRSCLKHENRDSPETCGEDFGDVGCPSAAHGG